MNESGPSPSGELSLERAREALESYVRTRTWLRRDLAKKLDITSFERSGSFHVVFESFIEQRGTTQTHVPFFGGRVDGPENGPPPAPWDIPVEVPGMFIQQEHHEPVPHTDEIKTCYTCHGSGRVQCSDCGGDGRKRCSSCGGDGRVTRTRTVTSTNFQGRTESRIETYTESCWVCGGDGRVTCGTCSGTGRVTCGTCDGACRLKHYLRLDVTWSTPRAEKVLEKTDLPDELIEDAVGDLLLHDEEDRIEPEEGGGTGPYRGRGRVNAEVNAAANELIGRHRFSASTKLYRQRLLVRAVPVYEAHYRWGKETRRFWVFGRDEQIHAPRYPLSIVRIGLAVGVPLGVLGTALGVGTYGATPPPRTPPAVVSTPTRTPPPIPTLAPLPTATATQAAMDNPLLLPLVPAAVKPPVAGPGKKVVEVRTDPVGVDVFVGAKRLGQTPLFVVLPANVTTKLTLTPKAPRPGSLDRAPPEVTLEVQPKDGLVIEHRF